MAGVEFLFARSWGDFGWVIFSMGNLWWKWRAHKTECRFFAFEKQKNVCVIVLALLHTMSHVMNLIKIYLWLFCFWCTWHTLLHDMPLSEEHRMWNAAPAALYQISTCLFRKMPLLQRSWKPHSWRDRRHLPIGSMGLVYFPTFGWFFMANVGKYTSPMDPMGLWGTLAFHISTSPFLDRWKRPENHRLPKVWWRKNPLREKLQSGWTPWFIRILDCKSARKSVCFIGILKVGGGQSSLRFPYKILTVP